MKRAKPVIFFLLAAFWLGASGGGFTINGNIKGIGNTWVYFNYLPDSGTSTVTDSVLANNSKFIFTGFINAPSLGILYTNKPEVEDYFFFAPGVTTVRGDTAHADILIANGSEETQLFNTYRQKAGAFEQTCDSALLYIEGKKPVNDSAMRQHYSDMYFAAIADEDDFTEGFVTAHPNNYISAYLASYRFADEQKISKGIALLQKLSPAIRQSKYAVQLKARYKTLMALATNVTAPGFALPDSTGKTISLGAYKGKYVLVDFWASWCYPCRRENPGIVAVYKKYHNKGFEILGVSMDENRERWLAAIYKDNLNWNQVCDFKGWDGPVPQLFAVNGIPANFLIGPDGKIIAKDLLGAGLEYKLQTLFGGK
ncbi:MAG TPA: AhpC/TSA family protein [Chitinophagales bacterium]|nr:AhpC/TSA family protein [Chitinophagales bacterium]